MISMVGQQEFVQHYTKNIKLKIKNNTQISKLNQKSRINKKSELSKRRKSNNNSKAHDYIEITVTRA
jgi:hypothetical protein